eukprot:scaffold2599_cov131-Amphora_coffeaeformis.AAC.1
MGKNRKKKRDRNTQEMFPKLSAESKVFTRRLRRCVVTRKERERERSDKRRLWKVPLVVMVVVGSSSPPLMHGQDRKGSFPNNKFRSKTWTSNGIPKFLVHLQLESILFAVA